MGPVAKKLIAEIEKQKRLGGAVEVLRAVRGAGPIEVPQHVPASVFVWMKSFHYLAQIASGIIGSDSLRPIADRVRDGDEDYLPHGPPDSPITTSFFFGWWAIDLSIGKAGESVATIAADVAKKYGGAKKEIDRLRALAEAHLRVLRIEARDGMSARVRDLVTEEELEVGLAAEWDGDPGGLWLARVVPGMCFTPYALDPEEGEREWREYFERVLGDATGDELRARYRHHMRGDPETYWLDYVLDGYSTATEQTLHLAGVPDRPETLPHADEDMLSLFEDMPIENGRDLLIRELLQTDLLMDALSDFMAARESFELPEVEPDEEMLLDPMLMAYAMYGIYEEEGETFLDDFLGAPTEELLPEEVEDLQATAAGWFSLFEVAHVKLDEGIEMLDLLRNEKVWIEEKAATRQIALGDLLAAWVQDRGGRITLEGTNLHFPRMTAESVKGFLQEYYEGLDESVPWKQRLAGTAPVIAALHEAMRERPPIPTILNEDGEEIVFSQARYTLNADVTAKLEAAGWEGEDGSFALLENERLIASAELEPDRLTLFATSPRQLEAAKERLEATLGEDAVHQTDVFEDAQVALRDGMARTLPEPEVLTAEMQAELRAFLENELRAWLDTPIPMLGNITPREAVRSERGKEDVKVMLLEQERLLEDHEQLDEPIDFRPLWASLGLEYPS